MKKRRPLYFSEELDADIVDYIKPLEQYYKFGRIVKDLMRDGMKYRRLLETGQIFENGEKPRYYKVPQSNTVKKSLAPSKPKQSLSEVKLEKKKVDKEDIGSRLLDF